MQSALAKLYVAWPRASRADSVDAYVRRVIINSHLDETRRPWRRESPTEDARLDRAAPAGVAPEDADALWAALKDLGPKQRRVVVLRHYWGLSVEETAADLGVSPGTVKSQTSAALDKLRTALLTAPPRHHPTRRTAMTDPADRFLEESCTRWPAGSASRSCRPRTTYAAAAAGCSGCAWRWPARPPLPWPSCSASPASPPATRPRPRRRWSTRRAPPRRRPARRPPRATTDDAAGRRQRALAAPEHQRPGRRPQQPAHGRGKGAPPRTPPTARPPGHPHAGRDKHRAR